MKVARYWARVSVSAEAPDGIEYTRTLVRGSDISKADAQQQAERACSQIAQNIRAGAEVDWYDYDRQPKPEPIDREWFNEAGVRTAAITINRYGIPVLNTAALVIVDVDLPDAPQSPGLLSKLFGKKPTRSNEEDALAHVRAWVRAGTAHSARLYRTAGGLRYILPATPMDPASNEVQSLMARFEADPFYMRLCKLQNSYRARLAPKPWRIGCRSIHRRSLEGGANFRSIPDYQHYKQQSDRFATCSLIEHLGPQPHDARILELIHVHDEMCKASSSRPLA